MLRDSLDELLDGARTGRWCYQHLGKTEKAHLGTVVEVNLTKEFNLPDGRELDWNVAGVDLDCKFSKDIGGWEIPMEMYKCLDHGEQSGTDDHPAMLIWMSDDTSEWAVGLFRASDERLRWKLGPDGGSLVRAYNRDNKRKIAEESLSQIFWLWGGTQRDLPENTLLHMDPARRGRILMANRSGQQRVDILFRENLEVVMRRPVLCTVAQQDDAPKRARDSRQSLQSAGIVVLGHQEAHPAIAAALNLSVPQKGEWLAVRLAKVDQSDQRPKVFMDGAFWSVATETDRIVPAPQIPRHQLPAQPHKQ